MARSKSTKIARRVIRELWNDTKTDAIDDLYDERVSIRAPGMTFQGRDGVQQFIGMYHEAFPDLRVENLNFYPDENDTGGVMHWKFSGTHRAALMGIEPTNEKVTLEGLTMSRLDGEMIVEEFHVYDRVDLVEQLGVSPADLEG